MNRRSSIVATIILAGLASGACVMPDQFSQLQKDVADVRQQLQRIEDEQAAAIARLEALRDAPDRDAERVTKEEVEDLGFRMERATRDAAEANRRSLELGQRVERLSQQLDRRANTSPTVTPLPPGPLPGGPGPTASASSAEELYNTAYADFSKGNYDLAIAGFLEFQQTYPQSSQADNALYWVGECNFSQGKFPEAIRAFDRLLEAYPDSDKAASGDLKKGLAYLEQNEVGKAIVQLQFVHDTYRGTDEARVARDRLSSLGVRI